MRGMVVLQLSLKMRRGIFQKFQVLNSELCWTVIGFQDVFLES